MTDTFLNWLIAQKGGEGSGNFGHSGRPGKVGGSADSETTVVYPIENTDPANDSPERIKSAMRDARQQAHDNIYYLNRWVLGKKAAPTRFSVEKAMKKLSNRTAEKRAADIQKYKKSGQHILGQGQVELAKAIGKLVPFEKNPVARKYLDFFGMLKEDLHDAEWAIIREENSDTKEFSGNPDFYSWVMTEKGGEGSGNFGHAGRPEKSGEVRRKRAESTPPISTRMPCRMPKGCWTSLSKVVGLPTNLL